jgi:hypothetical protein
MYQCRLFNAFNFNLNILSVGSANSLKRKDTKLIEVFFLIKQHLTMNTKNLFLITLLLFASFSCAETESKDQNTLNSVNEAISEKKEPSGIQKTTTKVDQNKLKGRWLRSDGTYMIEIKSVEANGELKAAYYNPNSIHVERAEWKIIENRLMISIKLQDVNYPGSTYTLGYNLADNTLRGNYFQAVEKTNYEVYFTLDDK